MCHDMLESKRVRLIDTISYNSFISFETQEDRVSLQGIYLGGGNNVDRTN